LWPPRPDRVDGGLALTLDPRAQHAVAEALRTPGPAAAVVVLDTDTGRILVSAATGGSAGEPTRADPEAERRFAEEHGHYARPGADGRLDDGAADPDCVRRSGDGTGQDGCWRWSYTAPAPVAKPDGALGRAYPFRAGADLVAAAAALGGADDDVPGQARKLGLRVGSCTGPDRWPVVPLAGSVASCLPERGEARGTPLALAVMTAAVANGGRTVRPRLVEQVTYPRTGLTVRVPGRSPAAAFPAGAARRLRADRYPTVDGLRQLSAVSRGSDRTYRWTCGFPESGALAFALVVEARDGDEADIRSRQLLASIRPSMEVPR
jgi:hypothetical protein